MAKRDYTHPHFVVRTKDESGSTRTRIVNYPLHRPIFFGFAERGLPNVPFWGDYTKLEKQFGASTFDALSKYYGSNQLFAVKGALPNQAVFFTRLIPDDAKTSTVVIECHLTENVQVTQYKRDALGGIVYDSSLNPVPLTDAEGEVVKETGVKIKYMARKLLAEETLSNIIPKTVTVDGVVTTIYPIVAMEVNSAGMYGDRCGVKFYFDYDTQDEDILDINKVLYFTFVPVEQDYDSDIAYPITDKFGKPYSLFSFKPDQQDKDTLRRFSFDDIIEENFVDPEDTEMGLLPYKIQIYSDNVLAIGDKIRAVEVNDLRILNGWMVDVLSAKNLDGYPYHHVVLDTTSAGAITLSDNYVIYLQGGSDGTLTDEKFEELLRAYLDLQVYPPFKDNVRYPITHMYDPGYKIQTKYAMIKLLGVKEDLKIILATQDASQPLFTIEESASIGVALRARAILQPESTYFGTPCCRAEIFGQAGYLNDTTYKKIVPATLWQLMKNSQYQSGQVITGEPKGDPKSVIDIFKMYDPKQDGTKVPWVPYDPAIRQMLWDNAINYFEYADMTTLFYADVRTVYTNDTSLLSDSTFTDAICIAKHIMRRIWAKYSGVTTRNEILFPQIEKEINRACYTAFNGMFTMQATVFQTESEVNNGDQYHITGILSGTNPKRTATADIIARRDVITKTTA